MAIIDQFEVVQIDNCHRQRIARQPVKDLIEAAAVGDAGERIGQGQVCQFGSTGAQPVGLGPDFLNACAAADRFARLANE